MKLVESVRNFLDDKCNMLATGFYTEVVAALEELEEEQEKVIESPVEQMFFTEWRFRRFVNKKLEEAYLEPQYQDKTTGKYRLDFNVDFIQEAYILGRSIEYDEVVMQVEPLKLGIEIDSHIWHEKTKEQASYDKERERFLVSKGWRLLRFTGSEVFNNAPKCVDEALKMRSDLAEGYFKKIRNLYDKKRKNSKGGLKRK